MKLLWIIALVPVLGLFWYLFAGKGKQLHENKDLRWPEKDTGKNDTNSLLFNRDPWEVADWLVNNFTGREDLWPALADVLQELGYEGIYLAELAPGSKGPAGSQKVRAIEALGVVGTARSLPFLMEALAAKDEQVSMAAGLALKKLRLPESRLLLVESLVYPGRVLPARSAEILLAFGQAAARDILAALPQAEPQVRLLLIEILGEFNDRENMWSLLPYLDDPQEEIRCKTIESLGKFTSPELSPYFIRALGDPFWKVRAYAAQALGRLKSEESIPCLKELSRDSDWHVRTNALEALEQIGVALEKMED